MIRQRAPIARVGRRGRRQAAALALFREQVRERADGRCEGHAAGVCLVGPHSGAHAHHIFPADRALSVQDPERGLWLCWAAHRWVHDHPADAQSLGLLRAVKVAR